MIYDWLLPTMARRREKRNAENIQADIEELKRQADKEIELAFSERRSYCILNLQAISEREITVLESHLVSLEAMPEKIKEAAEWHLDKAYTENRLASYKDDLAKYTAELEDVKTQLKQYRFNKDKRSYDDELAELADVAITPDETPKTAEVPKEH